MDPILKIENLSKKYHSSAGIENISFSLLKSETLSIIGPSGSGKSTLLRCIAGLEKPERGSIHFFGREIQNLKGYREIGMVFQSYNIFPHMTVLDNVSIALRKVKKYSREESEKIASRYLDQVQLSEKRNEYPEFLSGGQQQRVGIARALAMSPKLLLFDEPTSALDPKLSSEVFRSIRDIKTQDMTLVIVTHDMKFCRQISDKVLYMEEGGMIEHSAAESFFKQPSTSRAKAFLYSH